MQSRKVIATGRVMAMPQTMQSLIEQYIAEIKKIYGTHLRKVILYGTVSPSKEN